MRQRFYLVLAVLTMLVGLFWWGTGRVQAFDGNLDGNGPRQEGCSSADIVFITSDEAAARAIETLADILAMHHWAHCPRANYRIGVVDAVHGQVLLGLTPVTLVDLASWRDAEGLQISIKGKQRPSFRYQWDGAFNKALEILRKNGDPSRRQILVYAGDIALDAHPETAEKFVRTELADILQKYRTPEVWILSGEEDPQFQNVKKAWKDVIEGRGGFLPEEDKAAYIRPVDYLDAIFSILQKADKQFYVQKVGCGIYEVPSTSMLALAWLRDSNSQKPEVTLEWKARNFSSEVHHDNVWQPTDRRGLIITDPPVGEVMISAAQCGALVGFAQIGVPSIEVKSVDRLPQDRGQAFSGGALEARLLGWQGKSYLGIGKPYPQLTLIVKDPTGDTTSLKFQPKENKGVFVSDPLPRKVVGTYHWHVTGVLPYNGLEGGNGKWVLPGQEGGYQVYAVGVIKVEVTVEGMDSANNAVMLHDSIQNRLAIRPVVVRLQVKDEKGHLLSPQDLFEDPNQAFQAILTNIATGEQDKTYLIPKSSFWYGEMGKDLGHTGMYRLEVYKKPPSAEVFVWDTEAPWRLEFRRQDPFFHRPVVWAVLAGLLAALIAVWLGWNVYVRTSPLKGILEFRVAANNVLIRRIDLSTFRRRRITLGREVVRYALPVMKIKQRGRNGLSIQADEGVKALDIAMGEEKPLLRGVVVRYIPGLRTDMGLDDKETFSEYGEKQLEAQEAVETTSVDQRGEKRNEIR